MGGKWIKKYTNIIQDIVLSSVFYEVFFVFIFIPHLLDNNGKLSKIQQFSTYLNLIKMTDNVKDKSCIGWFSHVSQLVTLGFMTNIQSWT